MSARSKIEWCDATWNPVRGCSRVSEGCRNCYAERIAARFSGIGPKIDGGVVTIQEAGPFRGYAEMRGGEARWTGEVALVRSMLDLPLRWKKPKRIFVNSMSDLFHEKLPDESIDRVFAVMALCPQHTFLVLTKRAERMRDYLGSALERGGAFDRIAIEMMVLTDESCERYGLAWKKPRSAIDWWPLQNVWLGVSVENQATADERIPHLLETPAAIRFVSYEPALGTVDFRRYFEIETDNNGPVWSGLDWIICGGESGPDAREMHPDWAWSVRDQCAAAKVPFFFKQWGEWVTQLQAPSSLCLGDYKTRKMHGSEGYWRVGKKRAGRLLDGREHNELPKVTNA